MTDITTALQNITDRIANLYRDQLIADNRVATGKLKEFTADFEYDGNSFRIYFNLEDYFKYVEEGMPPTPVSRKTIENWMRVKKILPQTNKAVYVVTRNIANKIEREGYKGIPSLQTTIDSPQFGTIVNEIKDLFFKKFNEEITELLNKTLQQKGI